MSDAQLLKSECASQFTIKNEDDTLTFTLTMDGLPDIVKAAIMDCGEKLVMPIIAAIMTNIGAMDVRRLSDADKAKLEDHDESRSLRQIH